DRDGEERRGAQRRPARLSHGAPSGTTAAPSPRWGPPAPFGSAARTRARSRPGCTPGKRLPGWPGAARPAGPPWGRIRSAASARRTPRSAPPLQRRVVPDGQVVHQGQRQGEVRGPALRERLPLLVRPAQRRAGVGEVDPEREDPFVLLPGRAKVVLIRGGL